MKVHYEGSETIPAPYADVWAFMNSPDKVAACLPDVVSTTVADAKHFTSRTGNDSRSSKAAC